MEDKIRIGVSACLLGQQVRFDGGHKRVKVYNPKGMPEKKGVCSPGPSPGTFPCCRSRKRGG